MVKHPVAGSGAFSGSAPKRQRVQIIDISSDGSEVDEDGSEIDDDSSEVVEEDNESPPAEVIPVTAPSISSLPNAYPTRSALTTHLSSLPKPILVGMIVDHALPPRDARSGKPTGLAHCVYCHVAFSLDAPYAGKGCRIKHYTEVEDSGDEVKYDCCGAWMEYSDNDPDIHGPPELELGNYCWVGRHHTSPLKKDDFARQGLAKMDLDEEYEVEGLGTVKLKDALWWKNWEEYGGKTCTKACYK